MYVTISMYVCMCAPLVDAALHHEDVAASAIVNAAAVAVGVG